MNTSQQQAFELAVHNLAVTERGIWKLIEYYEVQTRHNQTLAVSAKRMDSRIRAAVRAKFCKSVVRRLRRVLR